MKNLCEKIYIFFESEKKIFGITNRHRLIFPTECNKVDVTGSYIVEIYREDKKNLRYLRSKKKKKLNIVNVTQTKCGRPLFRR